MTDRQSLPSSKPQYITKEGSGYDIHVSTVASAVFPKVG